MTEHDWLTAGSNWPLWHHLATVGLLTVRKKELFGVAACRRVAHLPADPRSLRVVDVCEAHADGLADFDAFGAASAAAFAAAREADRAGLPGAVTLAAAAAKWLGPDDTKLGRAAEFSTETFGWLRLVAAGVVAPDADAHAAGRFWDAPAFVAGREAEERVLADVVRDLFGNPFRPARWDPRWRTEPVARLAGAVYAGRAWDRLPVLADALEDAGCDAPEVLAHCRHPNPPAPHARGCWAVDLVLGRS